MTGEKAMKRTGRRDDEVPTRWELGWSHDQRRLVTHVTVRSYDDPRRRSETLFVPMASALRQCISESNVNRLIGICTPR